MEPNIADPIKEQLSEQGMTSALPSHRVKPKSLTIMWSLLLLIALITFGAWPRIIQQTALTSHKQAQLEQAPPVSYVVAQLGPAIEEFTLPGSTQAIQDAPIYARIDGYLRKRYVDIGDKVHAGQVLADIDTPELDKQVQAAASAVEQAAANLDNSRETLVKAQADERTAAANVQKANTDLSYASVQYGRYKLLAQQGAVSLEDRDTRLQAYNADLAALDAATSAQKSAAASIKSAKAAIHVAEAAMSAAQSQHDQYQSMQSFKKVTALFDGTVVKRNVDAGALVTSGSNTSNQVLFEIAKTNILRIYVYVPEQYVPDIYVGEKALLNFQAHASREFTGTVSNIAGGLDTDSKTLQVEIMVSNDNSQLLPGMYAQVRFQTPSHDRLLILPGTALQTRPDGLFVYTVDKHNRLHLHKIEVGRDLGGQIEISRGLQEGDRVIINPSDEFQEELLVNPSPAPVMSKPESKKQTG